MKSKYFPIEEPTQEEIELARAKRYREYLLGWAYIPIQELGKYKTAYKKIFLKKL